MCRKSENAIVYVLIYASAFHTFNLAEMPLNGNGTAASRSDALCCKENPAQASVGLGLEKESTVSFGQGSADAVELTRRPYRPSSSYFVAASGLRVWQIGYQRRRSLLKNDTAPSMNSSTRAGSGRQK